MKPRGTRLCIVTILAALAGVAAFNTSPAHAVGATSAICTNLFTITIDPGWSMTPTSGTVTSGNTGSVTCIGKIAGHRVTGPGTMGIEENYTDVTCPSSIITGTIWISIPTTDGLHRMHGALRVQRVGLLVRPEARFRNAHFSGIGIAIPTQGTCLLTPLRQARLSVTGTLSGT